MKIKYIISILFQDISSEVHKYIKNHIRIEDFASVVPRRWLQQQTENRENDGSNLMMPRETIE